MRHRVMGLLLALMPITGIANDLALSFVETKDLRLIYFNPLGYLVPHAVRTFTNIPRRAATHSG